MSSLAEAPDLVGFFSYSREDDEDSGGKLSKLRERIQAELRGQLGRANFRLWQDKTAIAHGKLWEEEIKSAIAQSVFFIPIITPTAVRSRHWKFEFDSFLAREKELGRHDLVFPILYISVPELAHEAKWRDDPVLSTIARRQYFDWRGLRHLDVQTTTVRERIDILCCKVVEALNEPWVAPEERRRIKEARPRQKAEEKTRQLEAEAKRRAHEEKRQRQAAHKALRRARQQAEEETRPLEERNGRGERGPRSGHSYQSAAKNLSNSASAIRLASRSACRF